jgi:hypothetical protein
VFGPLRRRTLPTTKTRSLLRFVLIAALLSSSTVVAAALAPARPVADVIKDAAHLQAQGRNDAALELLKLSHSASPDNGLVVTALAQAYIRMKNPVWAIRVLTRYLEEHENDCVARLLLAWVQLQQGGTHQSRQLLDQAGCSSPPEVLARRQLLIAFLDLLEDRRERASEFTERARSSSAIFEEDQALLAHLTAATVPERIPSATGLVDLANGWTSNGLAGSPVDQISRKSSGTAITILDARLRLMMMNFGRVRPLVEGQLRTQQLWSDSTSDLSFRTGTGRAGVLLGRDTPRLLALVAVDTTQTQGGDRYSPGPLWFSESERGELELELPGSLFIMAGGGHRSFREIARTRTEIDTTIGWAAQQANGLRFLGGISGRYHAANNDAYDLLGLTAVSQARFALPRDFEAGATVSVSVDSFLHSDGYFFPPDTSTRRDVQWRAITALYTPRFAQVRLVARYELTSRASSASAYEFTDHRGLVSLEWRIDSDTFGHATIPAKGRAVVDYGALGRQKDSSSSQLRELMRQEETQRRGSSCLR